VCRCRRLLQDGQYGCAAQALASLGQDFESPEAYAAMQEKHPVSETPPRLPNGTTPRPATLTTDQVMQALRSFPNGSEPGPSGLRPEHVKAAAFCPSNIIAENTIRVLTSFSNLITSGKAPPIITPYFFGANLFAARKKDGSHRPIAVGEVLRRLVSKALAFEIAPRAASLLKPYQLGVGVPGGCEGIIHAITAILENPDIPTLSKCVLQVDFVNAFNLVDRETVFEEVRQHFSELAAWVELSYGSQAHLLFANATFLSCIGLHQGDSLAPLLFALCLLPLVLKIAAEIPNLQANTWFLDDGTIVGHQDDLSRALEIILEEGPRLGLQLAPAKSRLWCGASGPQTPHTLSPQLGNIPQADAAGFELLSVPVGDPTFSASILDKKDRQNPKPHHCKASKPEGQSIIIRPSPFMCRPSKIRLHPPHMQFNPPVSPHPHV
jgi:hypothetical protein